MSKIVIIDYHIGNVTSVKNMLKKAGETDVIISGDPTEIALADKLILPGVGHFDYGMSKLKESGLITAIEKHALTDKKPILGICLGAQLMTQRSDEGTEKGLGWIDGETVFFDNAALPAGYKIPHMGWNYVTVKKDCPLMADMPEQPRFYFVHSFHLKMHNPAHVWLTTNYGYEFCVAYQKDNLYACQFHPEKSHKFGMKLMENFVRL
ncbi:MAG: imidazole glycerol phosphate synthase subunit HisH [Flavobacteriales bacterium]|nr:imidazole glycerol phosphate synthase subunit HisH [Flavobacteriales bacterium]